MRHRSFVISISLAISVGIISASIFSAGIVKGDDFLSFRGVNGWGVAPEQTIPLTWSESENLAWKVYCVRSAE